MTATKLYIDGSWVDGVDGESFSTVDPATGEEIAAVVRAGRVDADRAIAAARRAFDTGPWPTTPPRERAAVLRRIAAAIRADAEELARLESRDAGKLLTDATEDVAEAAEIFDYYAGLAVSEGGEIPPSGPDAVTLVVSEPVGVAALITPWNFPLLMAAQKVAPALAAGCTTILKPAEQAPLSSLELARIAAEAGLPPGVLNVLTGFGPEAGAPLVEDPRVDAVSFTGSEAVGRIIGRTAAETFKRVTLELGGKSPNVVFADADFDAAMEGSAFGVFFHQGQVCSAGSRVLVERSIYDEAVEALCARAAEIRLGHPADPEVSMGPLISAEHRAKVNSYLEHGRADGARLAYMGQLPTDPDLAGGFYFPPLIFTDVDNTMKIAREEIFGPVMAVIPFTDEEEAVALANDTTYGLAAAVWTSDVKRAVRVSRAIRAGVVWVNDSQPAPVEAPWGGFKASGIGRELGRHGLRAYQETKQIYLNLD